MTKKENKLNSHNPLLYIDQPQFDCVKPTMQQVYQTSKAKENEEALKREKQLKPKPAKNAGVEP